MAKTGPKYRTKTDQIRVVARVAEMDRRGYTQLQIADEVGITQPMVSIHLKKIREEYDHEILTDRRAYVNEKLAQIRDVAVEAWKAWQKSWENSESRTDETPAPRQCFKCKGSKVDPLAKAANSRGQNSSGKRAKRCTLCNGTGVYQPAPKVTTVVEGRLPGAEYLRIILDCRKMEADLLGVWAPKETHVVGTSVSMTFDDLIREMAAGPSNVLDVPRLVEAEPVPQEDAGGK